MKVRDVMKGQPAFCSLDATLASAIDSMQRHRCGFLPVLGDGGNVVGVITDRDISIALGTRNQKPADILVKDVILPENFTFPRLFTCSPDDDVHSVLKTMRSAKIRRLPVVDREGGLVGILSLNDIVLHACAHPSKHDISCKDVVEAYRAMRPPSRERRRRPAAA